jgi:NADH-quinone oxidoreductase subunit A
VLHEYGHIAILVIIALVFPAGALIQSWIFQFVRVRPRVSSDPIKEDTYECGMVTRGSSLPQFNFGFYVFALLFLLIDVEIVFLFPWTLVFEEAGAAGLFKVFIFLATFVVGGLYAWRKRSLEWR